MTSKINHMIRMMIVTSLVSLAGAAAAFGAVHDNDGCTANRQTIAQLAAAYQATARFNSIKAAEAAGYSGPVIPVSGMGVHYVNGDLIDNTFDPAAPEALVYADLGNGEFRLVAVEYIAPLSATAPAGFEGTCDEWSPFADTFWTLHAWIWEPNLSGTFARLNPLIP